MNKKLVPFAAMALSFTLASCGASLPKRTAHKDVNIYSTKFFNATSGKFEEKKNLTWKDSYDAVVAETKKTTGKVRDEYLHLAEDLLMETGAIVPLYYYTDIFLMKPQTGFYMSPLGYKFFNQTKFGDKTEYTVCVGPKADSYDPALNSAVDGAIIIGHNYEGLMKWAKSDDETDINAVLDYGQIDDYDKSEPAEDGTVTYTFHIDDDAKFSDGTPVKPSHFAKSWARAASGKLAADYGYMFDCIVGYEDTAADAETFKPLSGVVADDDKNELKVTIIADLPYFLELTAFPTYFPLKEIPDSSDWWLNAKSYVGNGPMKMESIDNKNGGSVVFVKNENYLHAEETVATKVTFALTEDDTAQYNSYNSGDYVFIDSMPQDVIDKEKTNPEFYKPGQLGTYYVVFNVNDNKLNAKLGDTKDKDGNITEYGEAKYAKFRKALSLLIDRNYICEQIGKAGQEPANTFVGKGITDSEGKEWTSEVSGPNRDGKGYFKVGKDDYKSNCEEGVSILKELGFKFDEKNNKFTDIPSISYLYNEGTGHQQIGEYLQSAFKTYGIDLKLESQEWAVFLNTRKNGDYSIARNGWLSDYNDACSFIDMWTTESGNNDAQFGR